MSNSGSASAIDARGPLDLAGIGIGPFNLSVAALIEEAPDVRAQFFDKKESFDWHPGMMLPDVELQSSFLKDLVTPVRPTSPWSFIAYLVANRRLFAYLNAQYPAVPRQEMANYFSWAASKLRTLSFNSAIREVDFDGRCFRLRLDRSDVTARNVVIGTGTQPFSPDWAEPLPGRRCFHCTDAKWRLDDIKSSDRVVVVGGGQSGGEVVDYLLSRTDPPHDLKWLSRRHNFEPINETPFSNQVFSPEYVAAYRRLSETQRAVALDNSILTSDGLSLSTIDSIYRKLYRIRHIDQLLIDVAMLPTRNVFEASQFGEVIRLSASNAFDGGTEVFDADYVVLATGFQFVLPEVLSPIADRIALDRCGRAMPRDDYVLKWDGPANSKIFAQNAGRDSHGIADSQLSLMAWRSAAIINRLLGREQFDLKLPEPVLDWLSMEGAGKRSAIAAE